MKTLKKLKVAAAVATMFASVGGLQAATISQSGGTLAMETIQPGALPTPQSNFTRVRAPAVTYSWANGPNAQANGTQSFEVVFTLGSNGPLYAFSAATSGEVGGLLTPPGGVALMARNAANTAETISARLRGAVAASRINVRATNPAAGNFAIVLRQIDIGNTLPGSDLSVHPNDNRSVTYRFDLVNNTASPIALSDLDLTFNTTKDAGNLTDYFTCEPGALNCRQVVDTPTSGTAEFAAIHNLAGLVVATTGHTTPAMFNNSAACGPDPIPMIAIRGNSGINNFQGTEPNTNVPATNVPTYNPSYIQIRRALDVMVSNFNQPHRRIATTNSFAENYSAFGILGVNLTPTNGIGGQGGGRYTFVPTVKSTPSIGFGPGLNPTVAPPAGPFSVATPSSGDERDAHLGAVSFRNRAVSAADRLMLSDLYRFKGAAPPPAANAAAHDFGTPGQPNVAGGVDIRSPLFALRLSGTQAGSLATGGSIRLLNLAAMPAGQQTCASSAGFGVAPTITGAGTTFNWDWSHAQLLAAADPQGVGGAAATLANADLSICYNVPGNTTVPQAAWTNVVATLMKDDVTEQMNVSCPGDLAQVYGGVKVDVRNFVHSGAPGAAAGWQGILRVINNSETDTAQVDAQYIYNDGRYGNWGTIIPALPPRGAGYVTGAQIYNALTNVASSVPAAGRWDGQPTAAQLNARTTAGTAGNGTVRIRVSADVPTIRVQNYIYNEQTQALTEVSSSQGADFANIESSNRDHIDQDAQTDIRK